MIKQLLILNIGVFIGGLLGAWFIYSTVVIYIARHSGAALEHALGSFIDWDSMRR